MTQPVENNLKRNLRYREDIVRCLHHAGLTDAKAAPVHRASEAFNPPSGHIEGLKSFEILVQSSVRARPSEGLDEARALAKEAGKPFSAIVLDRPMRRVPESYVILRLDDFAQLVRDYEDVSR